MAELPTGSEVLSFARPVVAPLDRPEGRRRLDQIGMA